ncbi:unnamed protein product [Dovyalis caffra]|uniref:Major facilitator superfamily (MFS) profile domain-containing protein n=1 Tax=Dovyalis caffra TaxID=77055 RepID=A0AAV1RE65_9ROSI|nr:unnamed protein product [Dovyalis caffra]
MNSSLNLNQPIRIHRSIPLQNHKSARFKLRHSPFVNSSSQNCYRNVSFSPSSLPIQPRIDDSLDFHTVPSFRARVSSNDARFGSLSEDSEPKAPSFSEFITSERIKVVSMVALALALCNADRVVMSVAIVPLSLANGWSRSFSGIVQSSFLWGYLISPIAGGTLVDYYGGKIVMGWGVALWSLATFLTPWAADTSVWALLATRAMLGVAEGVALPCMNNMIARWFPQTERARAVGIAMAGFQLGNAIGLTLSPILMSKGGIFGPFVIFGLSGFLWVLVWLSAISSTPDCSSQISKYELEYILNKGRKSFPVENKPKTKRMIPPFRRLLSKMPTWSLIVANAMHSWGFFVILSWMPIYFNTMYHVDLKHAAWFSAVPWSVMGFMGYFGGTWSDMLIRRGISVSLTRKIMQSIGFFGPGIALIGLTTARSPLLASAWLTLAVGLKSFSHSGFLVNLQEIAPHYSGVLHGISNTAGTFAAIVGTVGAGFFVELVGSFRGFLLLTSLLYFLAALFYNIFSTGERFMVDRERIAVATEELEMFRNVREGCAVGIVISLLKREAVSLIFLFFSYRRVMLLREDEKTSGQYLPNAKFLGSRSVSTDLSTGSNSKSSSKFKSSSSYGSSSVTSGMVGAASVSIQEIFKMTDNFSPANKVGDGSFSNVYKGRLRDGSLVAVKRAKKNTYDKRLSLEFQNEALTLSKIEHLNLVRLYGYVEQGDERIIVVEYVGNGNLREHLDGTKGSILEIAERLDIAIDVAHAITYLHTYTGVDSFSATTMPLYQIIHKVIPEFPAELAPFIWIGDAILGNWPVNGSYVDCIGSMMNSAQEELVQNNPLLAMQRLKEGDAIFVMDPLLRRSPGSTMALEKVLKLAHRCLAPAKQSRPFMKECGEVLWGIRKDLRASGTSSSSASTSHQSADFPRRDAKKNREEVFGIEAGERYEFFSA